MKTLFLKLTDRLGIPICHGCFHEIDPSCCHCGDLIERHDEWSGHSPIPLGCTCGYHKASEMKGSLFEIIKSILRSFGIL